MPGHHRYDHLPELGVLDGGHLLDPLCINHYGRGSQSGGHRPLVGPEGSQPPGRPQSSHRGKGGGSAVCGGTV